LVEQRALGVARVVELGLGCSRHEYCANTQYFADFSSAGLRSKNASMMRFAYTTKTLPLQVPDCEGSTFASVFWRLNKLMQFRSPTHLYFAPLHWKAPSKSEAYIEWQLNAGDWDTVNNRRGTSYRVRVDWTDWSSTQCKWADRWSANFAAMDALIGYLTENSCAGATCATTVACKPTRAKRHYQRT
jgi:hypothetical protein